MDELADAVGPALVRVLASLDPAARLVFVLHDVFGLPYDEIAPIIERTPTVVRQLADHARREVQAAAPT